MVGFTQNQKIALANIPRLPALLSILGSFAIIHNILSDWRQRLSTTYHRIIFFMSVIDILQSTAQFFTTLPMPKGTPGAWGAIGNTATCEAQGFFIQVGIAMPIYTICLTLYYLLTVRCNLDETFIARKIEPVMHLVALAYPTTWAFVALSMDLYNPMLNMCHIYPSPKGCDLSDDIECIRGENAKTLVWVSGSAIVFASLITVPVNLAILYFTIRKQDERMKAYGESMFSQDLNASRVSGLDSTVNSGHTRTAVRRSESKRARAAFSQAIHYVGAFFLVFIWLPVVRICVLFVPIFNIAPVLFFLNFFYPMQGFFNFFIYMRPTAHKIRKRNPSWSFLKSLTFATIHPKQATELCKRRRSDLVGKSTKASRINSSVTFNNGEDVQMKKKIAERDKQDLDLRAENVAEKENNRDSC